MQIERSIDARALKKASAVIVSQNYTPGLGLHQKLLSLVLEFNYPSLKETISFRLPLLAVAQTRNANVKGGKKLGFEQRNPNETKASLSFQFAGLYANFYHLFGA